MTEMADDGAARRLLKLHAASTRSASSHARALCLGPSSVVFHVALRHSLSGDVSWVAALSATACRRAAFGARDALRDAPRGRLALALRGRLLGLLALSGVLALTAFSSRGVASTARRHRAERAVDVFMAECWSVLSLLLLVPAPRGRDGSTHRQLTALLSEVLAVPRDVLTAHQTHARAVRGIKNSPSASAWQCVCCVCLDTLDNKDAPIVHLPCCHALHEDCALAWLARKPNCPHCRADL